MVSPASPAQGDILYFDGSNWVRLPAGTSGQFLKTLGSGADPAWDSPAGSGDMQKSTYDTNNLATDIFNFAKLQAIIFG